MKKLIFIFSQLFAFTALVNGQVVIGTPAGTPTSNLEVRGGMALGQRTFSTSTTLDLNDHIAVFTGTSATTITLPDATACIGRSYWVKNYSGIVPVPVLTLNTTSSQTIDDALSYNLDEPNEVIRVTSDGVKWEMASQDVPLFKSATTGGSWNQGGNTLKTQKSIGTISNSDFPFITNNTEALRITSAGFIGLGNPSPAGRLHFTNSTSDAGDDYIFADYANGSNTIQGGLYLRKAAGSIASPANLADGDNIGQFRFAGRQSGTFNYTGGSGIDAYYRGNGITNTSDLRFFTSATEQIRMNDAGKISIGTTVPDGTNPEKLLVDAGSTGSFNVISGKGDIDNYLQLNIQNNSAGTAASSDIVATADNGDENVNFIDMGINSTGNTSTVLPILAGVSTAYLYATGADFLIGNSTAGSDLLMFTGGYAASNERLRITAAGNVGIGVSIPTEKLMVAGIMAPSVDNSFSLGTSTNKWSEVWAVNGTIQTSDLRLKTNILPLEYGLDDLMKMRAVGYNWKNKSYQNHKIGFIAQETKKLIPEVVKGDETKETLGINYAELVPVLINSLQQQQHKLDELKAELATLMQN